MRFRTFLLISLVIVFFACLPLIIFEVIGEGEPAMGFMLRIFLVTLPIGAVVLGGFWIFSVFYWIFEKFDKD